MEKEDGQGGDAGQPTKGEKPVIDNFNPANAPATWASWATKRYPSCGEIEAACAIIMQLLVIWAAERGGPGAQGLILLHPVALITALVALCRVLLPPWRGWAPLRKLMTLAELALYLAVLGHFMGSDVK
jgi:hypothetical protein